MTPQIATRAYELYEQQGHRDGQSSQNWDKAEREIRKDEAKPEPKPKVGAEAKPTVEPQPESKVEPQPEANAKAEPKPATKVKPSSDVSPQLLKRVHKLYEDLGRQDVRAVQELEEAEQKIPGAGTKK